MTASCITLECDVACTDIQCRRIAHGIDLLVLMSKSSLVHGNRSAHRREKDDVLRYNGASYL